MNVVLLCSFILALAAQPAPSLINVPEAPLQVGLQAELGFLDVAKHTIQFSRNGSTIDYVKEGGQDVLFPFMRLSADVNLFANHTITLLYQPLDIRTNVVSPRSWSVDNGTFAPGKSIDLRYGFTFWRATYMYELFSRGDNELGLGGGLQIRDAIIDFTDVQAGLRRSERNIGPVPLLKARGRLHLAPGLWGAAEVDGFWAPLKYINGSGTDVVGAILDASVRVGAEIRQSASIYLNLRYLGGGASGTSANHTDYGDGYTNNWLNFFIVSLGAELR